MSQKNTATKKSGKKGSKKPASKPNGIKKTVRSYGQTGPALHLDRDALNAHEVKVLAVLAGGSDQKIANLAKQAFPGKGTTGESKGNSMVRNALRRLVRGKLVRKVARGTFSINPAGRSCLKGGSSRPGEKANGPVEKEREAEVEAE